jgi:hypothetical protein
MNSTERQKLLLNQLESKEISFEKFLENCALWGCEIECWVEYEIRQYPLPPADWQEYQNLPLERKFRIDNNFFEQAHIREYINLRSRIYAENWADSCWLKDMLKYLPETIDNSERRQKIKEKIEAFDFWFRNSSPLEEKVREIFDVNDI